MWRIPALEMLKKYSAGYDGVLLFFTISGFVISASLIPKMEESFLRKSILHVLVAFFCKRLFRITPTAVLWVVLTFLIVMVIEPSLVRGNLYAAAAAFFNVFNIYAASGHALPNSYGVYWSLSLEEQFYVALPIMPLLFRTIKSRLVSLAILVAAVELSGSLWIRGALQIPPIVGGVVLYLIDREYGLLDRVRNSEIIRRNFLVLLSALFTVILFVLPLLRPFYSHYLILMGVFCAGFVSVAAIGKDAVLNIPGAKWILHWLGSRSFTLYLSHLSMIYFVRYCWMILGPHLGVTYSAANNLSIFVTWLIATVMMTEASYRFLEAPLLKRGRVIAAKIGEGGAEIRGKAPASGIV